MARFNNGLIYTDSNCIACNKCISLCNILSANISVVKDGKTFVQVDAYKCNHCGKCISSCTHNARHFSDDADEFFIALERGEPISAVVSPSFYMVYGDKAPKILGYLKSLGLQKIYMASYGAEIALWATMKYIENSQNLPSSERAFISPNCPALVNSIELYYPFLRKKLIPVQSSNMCTAIYARNYLKDKNKFVYIGPCIASKDEFLSESTFGIIDYNLTFEHMMNYIDRTNNSYERFEGYYAKPDLESAGVGAFTVISGSYRELLHYLLPFNTYIQELTGLSPNTFQMLSLSVNDKYMDDQPVFSEVTACVNGCYECAGVDKRYYNPAQIVSNLNKLHRETKSIFADSADYKENQQKLNNLFKDLDENDFKRSYKNRYKQPCLIPENVLNEIFDGMLKFTESKRNINCGSCGYKSCKEMATSIAYGYNMKDNCIHYMQDEMQNRLRIDKLTGVPNRPYFLQQAEELFAKHPDTSYLLCSGDINRFKIVNDLYGSTMGDTVLSYVAKQLRQLVEPDGICGRLGGGGFTLFLENTPENLQKIRSCKFFDCSSLGMKIPVTMRFGITYSLSPDEDLMYLLNCATLCMDKQRSSIQNTYTIFTKEFREKMHQEATITSQMQNALDNDEFTLYYQPQYNASNDTLVGAEALCRWRKSDGTILLPSVFIPVAEKNGFIRVLDKIIWQKAFSDVKHWLDSGIKPVPISVNISRVSLESDALIYAIKRLGDEYKVSPEYIHFEITESAYMSEQSGLIDRINKLKELGYLIAMDDFGSGYSSLNTLKDLPIDILKLDMGFIRDETNMDKGGNIITSIVRMAHSLDLLTVAEGVETKEKVTFLKSIGCDIFQGFVFSRPINEKQFISLMQSSEISTLNKKRNNTTSFDLNNFFNPDSNESKMFEELTGPAAILSFNEQNDDIELIRYNQKCLKLFGLEGTDNKNVRKHLQNFLKKDKDNVYISCLRIASVSGNEEVCVTQNKNFITKKSLWVKSNIWKIGENDSNYIIYVLLSDITEEKNNKKNL